MAHKLEIRDIQYGVEMAWHKLTQVRTLLTKEDCFAWQILLAQSRYSVNGESVDHIGRFLPIASDDMLPVGNETVIDVDSYSPHTPSQAWEYMEEVLKGTQYTVVSAGTVCNRGKFFISVKLDELEALRPSDGNNVEMIFNFLGSLDKSLRHHLNVSTIRTVCYNTLMANFLAQTAIGKTMKHTKNMATKLDAHKPIMEQAIGYSAVVKATFNQLLAQSCTKDRARDVYTGFLVNEANRQAKSTKKEPISELSTRMENQIDEHVNAFERGKGNSGVNEYDLLNGFTEPRSTGFSYGDTDKFKTFESSEFGTFARQKGEFAALLTSNRVELPSIESIGRSILGNGKVAIAVN